MSATQGMTGFLIIFFTVFVFFDEWVFFQFQIVLGQTQFMGSEFRIFGGLGWVHSSVLVGKPGIERV